MENGKTEKWDRKDEGDERNKWKEGGGTRPELAAEDGRATMARPVQRTLAERGG